MATPQDIFVYDTTGTTELVTIDFGGGGGIDAITAFSVSSLDLRRWQRRYSFESYATDLVSNDSNGTLDVFLAANPLFDGPTTGNLDTLLGDANDNTVDFTTFDADQRRQL
ncbi:MAG: hypothetical protein H6888_03565 [Nitratireductor sp.]|nr:hypothetical protein [Nitratireductor sp.]